MARKISFFQTKVGKIVLNLLIAIAIILLSFVALLIWLHHYTKHGVEISVPNITGLYIEEAQITLTAEGLQLAIIDSTYSQKTPLGTLLEQNPKPGSKVKKGRTIYAIQNARFRRPVIMPELRDLSLRQAESTIKALGLELGEIIYEPSTYKDLILDVRTENTPIAAGTQVPEGTVVDLHVGRGPGVRQVTVPSIVGKSLTDARSWLMGHSLSMGRVEYDVEHTEETKDLYIVYSQTPESGTVVVEGTTVNIKLSTDIEKTVTADNIEDEEEFF
jgi:beta-lactam-binding protein with PASTA domain